MKIEELPDLVTSDEQSYGSGVGTIICLGTPPQTEFGIDYYSYTVSDQFIGFKNVPLGVHCIYYSFHGGERTCFFLALKSDGTIYDDAGKNPCSVVVILKYDPVIEDYRILTCNSGRDICDSSNKLRRTDKGKEHVNDDDEETVRRVMHEYTHMTNDQFLRLGEYPMVVNSVNQYEIWRKLSSFITPDVISRLEPIQKKIMSFDEELDKKLNVKSDDRRYRVFYTKIPRKLKKSGVLGSDLTKLNFDKSALLYQLLKDDYSMTDISSEKSGWRLLLGELQFSFVCFLMGHAFDGLEQWKRIIELLCSCDDAVHDISLVDLFRGFVVVLYDQLSVVPSDFFHDELSGNNFLRQQLISWFGIVGVSDLDQHENQTLTVDRMIVETTIQLKKLLWERFQVSLEDLEEMEDAPMIVDWM